MFQRIPIFHFLNQCWFVKAPVRDGTDMRNSLSNTPVSHSNFRDSSIISGPPIVTKVAHPENRRPPECGLIHKRPP
jgi:hypothetical protein